MTASDDYLFFNDFKSASGPRCEFLNRLFRTGLCSDLFDDTSSFPRMASLSNWMSIWRRPDLTVRFWFLLQDMYFDLTFDIFLALFSRILTLTSEAATAATASSPAFHWLSTFGLLNFFFQQTTFSKQSTYHDLDLYLYFIVL